MVGPPLAMQCLPEQQDENPDMADDSSNSTIQRLTTIIERQVHQIAQQAQQIIDQADLIKSLNHSIDCMRAQVTALNTQLSRNSRSDSLKRRPENQNPVDDDALSDDSVQCNGYTRARPRKKRGGQMCDRRLLSFTRIKLSGGSPMPLVVVILPKHEK
ncbi:unnamed protein product [Acanthoscelides obtectus]|uniref:Uncharacterized protein n=1 Tax=Acanthoscelides obtectus TaxID=200917 RepID=A0A9P0PCP2_ACAOB|nr:unnamed protein product [Acanthoscelides obtectus]CAK1640170.1 hypothetical protein AOBTE_LOCUS11571 [Acanthoscelides obtectus]